MSIVRGIGIDRDVLSASLVGSYAERVRLLEVQAGQRTQLPWRKGNQISGPDFDPALRALARGSRHARSQRNHPSCLQSHQWRCLETPPPIREPRQDLVGIADNIAELSADGEGREFDVFVSHATEDKDLVIRPLARALQERGLSVWYDEFELDGLVTMSVSNKQVLLPIWHDISKDYVMQQSPSLADKVALRATDFTIAEIADELSAVVVSHAQPTT